MLIHGEKVHSPPIFPHLFFARNFREGACFERGARRFTTSCLQGLNRLLSHLYPDSLPLLRMHHPTISLTLASDLASVSSSVSQRQSVTDRM